MLYSCPIYFMFLFYSPFFNIFWTNYIYLLVFPRLGSPSDSEVKNLPTMQETQERWVQTLGRKNPLEKDMAAHSSILSWRILDRGAWWATVHRVTESDKTE